MVYDVAIAGAGIAGCATAIHLAEAGFHVALLERHPQPRRKTCGEGIFPAGVHELQSLGLHSLLGEGRVLETLRFNLQGLTADARLSPAGYHGLGLQRPLLEEALLEKARSSGVDLHQSVRATGLIGDRDGGFSGLATRAGAVSGRVIVAADGMRSALRRAAGLEVKTRARRYGASAHFLVPRELEPRVDVFFHRGYELYLTPVRENLLNVAMLTNAAGMRPLAGGPAPEFTARAAEVLGPAELVDEVVAAGPFPVRARRPWRQNFVLAGDAAGFFDGVTGEGISLALRSSRLCAAAVSAHLKLRDSTAFPTYEKKIRALARASTLFGWLTLWLAAKPRLARLALGNLRRRPEVFAHFVAVSSGEQDLGSLRLRDAIGLGLGI